MDELRFYDTKWSKSNWQRQIYDHSYVKSNILNDVDELVYKTETDFRDKFMVTKGETWEGVIS